MFVDSENIVQVSRTVFRKMYIVDITDVSDLLDFGMPNIFCNIVTEKKKTDVDNSIVLVLTLISHFYLVAGPQCATSSRANAPSCEWGKEAKLSVQCRERGGSQVSPKPIATKWAAFPPG